MKKSAYRRFRSGVRVFLLCSGALATAHAATLPAGTVLEVRLKDHVSSELPAGSKVSAVVTVPVFVNGECALSSGVTLEGNTADVKAVDKTNSAATATVRIHFNRIHDAAGVSAPLFSSVFEIDNARETVAADGLVTGIVAAETWEGQLEKGLDKLNSKYAGLGGILTAVKGSILKPVDPTIDFQPGVELKVKLTRELVWKGSAQPPALSGIEPAAQLDAVVNRQPARTVAQNPPNPSDLTNVMLLGSAEQVQAAFEAAGWAGAAALSGNSKMETARAIIEDRGYKEAPVSILMLDGNPPDLVFQKGNDTFASRHHIRLWRRRDSFAGQEVWVAAGTHDIAINFSQTSHSFTHQIDQNIDAERSKVVNDLIFTGMVQGVALVERPDIPENLSNATGDVLKTDRRIAVLQLRPRH